MPLNTLPIEILQSIFRLLVTAIQYASDGDGAHYVLRHRATTLLRLICHSWNNIILTDPWFWSEIAIISSLDVEQHFRRPPPELVSLWLKRSDCAELNISLGLPDAFTLGQDTSKSDIQSVGQGRKLREYFLEVLPLLSHHSQRWKAFSIRSQIGIITTFFLPSLEQAHKLRKVDLRIMHDPDELYEGFSSLVSSLDRAPSLRHLLLNLDGFVPSRLPLVESLYRQIIPSTLSRLSHLRIWDPLYLSTLLSILQQCPLLASLQVTITTVNNTVPICFKRLELAYLEIVILHDDRGTHSFFDYVDLPKLKILSLSIPWSLDEEGHGDNFSTSLSTYLKDVPRMPKIVELYGWGLTLTRVLPLFDNPRLSEVGVLEIRCATPPEDGVVRSVRQKEPRLSQHENRLGWMDCDVYRELEHKIRELKGLLERSDILQPFSVVR